MRPFNRCFWQASLYLLAITFSAPLAAKPRVLHFVTHPCPPDSYEQNGRAAGPMVEILALACARIGIDCQTQILPWRRALSLVEQGSVEGIFSIVDIPERQYQLRLLRPVLSLRYAFFAPPDSKFSYTNPDSLRGHKIAAYGPSGVSSVLLDAVKTQPETQVSVVLDNPTAFKMLVAGRFGRDGLVLANEDVALNLMANPSFQGVKEVGVNKNLTHTIGLSRANNSIDPELAKSFNQALFKLCREGVVGQIAIRHGVRAAPC